MTTITWNPVFRPAEDALVYQLHASALPKEFELSIKFSYTSPTMRFDHAEFSGFMGKVEHTFINGKGTVRLTADLWPNNSNFISFVFTGADHGSIHIDSAAIAINSEVTGSFGPPPLVIGTPTLADFTVNPLPDYLAEQIPPIVLDFISSVYVGAFQRPAEYEGLVYWSQTLLNYIDQGYDAWDSLKGLTRDMYWAGTQNHEVGTDLSTADYIDFVYRNVLGREPEPEGKQYWIDYIEEKGRSEFLADFLNAALQPGNSDGDYVRARMAVANFYSQEAYSGQQARDSGATAALGDVLGSVKDEGSALDAIQGMIASRFGGGVAQSSATIEAGDLLEGMLLPEWLDDGDAGTIFDEASTSDEVAVDVDVIGLSQLPADVDPLG